MGSKCDISAPIRTACIRSVTYLRNHSSVFDEIPLAHAVLQLVKETIILFIYLFIVLRFQTSYNNCFKEAGTPQQLNTNYSGPFIKYQYKY
jgi:hypothetical protein